MTVPLCLKILHSDPMKRKMISFEQDEEGHWVANLECGHRQHVRHDPPFRIRPWVLTAEGRVSKIGTYLNCLECNPERT